MNKFFARQARELQTKLTQAQEEMGSMTVEASSGGGAVTVIMNGKQEVQSVKISKEAVDPDDVELLQDLIMAAVNEAVGKSQELVASHLGALTGGLKIPGL